MKSGKSLAFFLLSLLCVSSATTLAQQTSPPPAQRDPQAVAVLQQSIVAMGSQVPSDSVATGSIVTLAGPTTEHGTILVQTRGLDQTAEQVTTPTRNIRLVYSRGVAAEFQGSTRRKLSLERAVTAQSSIFPLPALSAASTNILWGLKYIGVEQLDICRCHHIQIWESFADRPTLQVVGEVSRRDVWVDATTAMVRRVSYRVREARGAAPVLPVEITFSDYRTVNGLSYPYTIQTSLNGTPYSTIKIQSVLLNTGLVDADFAVR
jgi:hypothetical protein